MAAMTSFANQEYNINLILIQKYHGVVTEVITFVHLHAYKAKPSVYEGVE